MNVPSPHLIKQIEDRLKKLGASETDRIEIMALVEDIHNEAYEAGYDECDQGQDGDY